VLLIDAPVYKTATATVLYQYVWGMGQCAGPLLILQYHVKSKMYAVCTALLCLIILKIGDLRKNVLDTKCMLYSSLKLLFLVTFCAVKYLASCAADAHKNACKSLCKESAVFNNFGQNCTC
jgi:hypothetical protein